MVTTEVAKSIPLKLTAMHSYSPVSSSLLATMRRELLLRIEVRSSNPTDSAPLVQAEKNFCCVNAI